MLKDRASGESMFKETEKIKIVRTLISGHIKEIKHCMALLLSEGFRNLVFFHWGEGGSGEMAGASLWGWRFRLRNPESSVDVLPFGVQNLSFSRSFVQKRKKKDAK